MASSIPSTMKAVQIDKNGGVEVLEYKDVPVPSPGPGEVLVRNEYAGVNFIDTYFRTGLSPAPPLPLTLGREAAGQVVAAAPDVASVSPGTRVVYMADPHAGTYAQYTTVAAEKAVAIPDNLSTEQAAASCTRRPAASACSSSEVKRELARQNGAEWTVDSGAEDLVGRVMEITGGHGADVIYDGVGRATFEADLKMIAMKGHLISFGNASGAVPPFSILQLGPKNVKLLRPIVYGYVAERKDLEKYSQELFDLVASGKVNVAIHEVYPLKDVARAHTDIESRKTTGKLVIKCD
ncbi:hypothetical protein HIM_02981 [Hirsutella minnesotensis 3608]|nr:hypothetical protein HIM_02981 [Hirsutella minnesotensis 3608]